MVAHVRVSLLLRLYDMVVLDLRDLSLIDYLLIKCHLILWRHHHHLGVLLVLAIDLLVSVEHWSH